MTETRVICDKCEEEIKSERKYFKVWDWFNAKDNSPSTAKQFDICSQGCLLKLLEDRCTKPRISTEIIKIMPAIKA